MVQFGTMNVREIFFEKRIRSLNYKLNEQKQRLNGKRANNFPAAADGMMRVRNFAKNDARSNLIARDSRPTAHCTHILQLVALRYRCVTVATKQELRFAAVRPSVCVRCAANSSKIDYVLKVFPGTSAVPYMIEAIELDT